MKLIKQIKDPKAGNLYKKKACGSETEPLEKAQNKPSEQNDSERSRSVY